MAGRNVNVHFGEPVRGGIQDKDFDPSRGSKKNAVAECSVKMEMEDSEVLSFHQVTLPEGGVTCMAESFETDPLAGTSEDMKPCIVSIKREKDFDPSQGLKGNARTECYVKMETEDSEVPAFYQVSLAEADASFMLETCDSDPLAVTSADMKPAIVGIKTDPVDPLKMKMNNTSVEAVGIGEERRVLRSAVVNRPCDRPSVNTCQRSSVICTLLDWRALSSSFGGRIVRGLITNSIEKRESDGTGELQADLSAFTWPANSLYWRYYATYLNTTRHIVWHKYLRRHILCFVSRLQGQQVADIQPQR